MRFLDRCEQLGEYGKQLISEYNTELNVSRGINIETLMEGSVQRISWKCQECNKVWETIASHRIRGSRCPSCSIKYKAQRNGRDLLTWCNNNGELGQKVIKQWVGLDEDDNKIDIDIVSYGASVKAKFRCPYNHTYTKKVVSITYYKKLECPICNGITSKPMKYSLVNWCNENGEKGEAIRKMFMGLSADNEVISINDISYGSHKEVQWKCDKGHVIIRQPFHMTRPERSLSCPICKIEGTNLKKWCEQNEGIGEVILEQWVGMDDCGESVDINTISCNSHKKVYWIDSEGNIYLQAIRERIHLTKYSLDPKYRILGNGEYKARAIKVGENDLLTWCKQNGERGEQLIKEWVGLTENDEIISMNNISRGSNRKVKWKCQYGHEWAANILTRTILNTRCPVCSNIKHGINDLKTWCDNHKEIGKILCNQWLGKDEQGNDIDIDKIVFSSSKKVGWKCSYGHTWYAKINNRVYHHSGCPFCTKRCTSYPEQFLYHALKIVFPDTESRCIVMRSKENPQGIEFDIAIPSLRLCIEYSPTKWHYDKLDRDMYKLRLCQANNVRFIYIQEDSYGELEHEYSDNYICFKYTNDYKDKQLLLVLDHILKLYNHSISEIDIEEIQEEAYKFMNKMK